MSRFFTSNPGCSGCGLMSCEGECFLQCEEDFAEPSEQPSLIELEKMRKLAAEKRKAA